MNGKVLQHLLQLRQDFLVPGVGKFSLEELPAEIQHGDSLILPPSFRTNFSQKPGKFSATLAAVIEQQYRISPAQAEKTEQEFAAEILSGLRCAQRHILPELGVLVSDLEGSIQFLPEKNRIQTAEFYGLRPVPARQRMVQHPAELPKETPVIPLQPFETKSAGKNTLRYAGMAAAGIAIASFAAILIRLNTPFGESLNKQAGIITVPEKIRPEPPRKTAATTLKVQGEDASQKMPAEEAQPLSIPETPKVSQQATPSAGAPEIAHFPGEQQTAPSRKIHKNQPSNQGEEGKNQTFEDNNPSSSVADPSADESANALRFFVVAGSFGSRNGAGKASQNWKNKGYQTALHEDAAKNVTRVSIGGFPNKEEALEFLQLAKPGFASDLWILSN